MSTLWTPGGEVPVDRDRPPAPGPEPVDDAELRARYEQMERQVLEAPAGDVVAQHAASLYELAALHLSREPVRLADVRLLIDALDALVGALAGRLGETGQALAAALPQLKMAYVEAADRAAGGSHATGVPEDVG